MAQIVELKIENFRQIRAATIRPDGSVVVISGPNGAGKTTVLHSIWALLKGKAHAGPDPIRKDAEACTIRGITGDFTATRTFKRTPDGEITTDLKLVMADGRKITSKPQAMLDALLPGLGLDPIDFMRQSVKDKLDILKGMVPGFDFADNAKQRKKLFDDRTLANRLREGGQARVDAIVLPPGKKPKPVDVAALLTQMQEAAGHNATLETRKARRVQTMADADAKLDEAEQLRSRAATLERDAKALQAQLLEAPALPEPINVDDLREQIDAAERVKGVVALHEQRATLEAVTQEHATKADKLTGEIADLDAAKQAAIANAKLPVDGLTFDDEQILLGGVAFDVASMAEKLRASVAIGMALCPPPSDPALRVMTIDEGSELDSNSMKLLHEMADAHGYQIWVAKVDETGQQGFVIVDGQVQE